MDVSERVTLLRKTLKLSQSSFGESIGVSRDVIKNIDNKLVPPKPLLLQQICKVHNVNPRWLETGEGDMFLPQTKDDVIMGFLDTVLADEEDSFRRRFLSMLASLDDDGWIFLENTLNALYPDKTKEKEQE